jgi:hypothetical protein
MVDSGICDLCGKPVEPAKAEMDIETGNLVHVSCLKQKQHATKEKEQAESAGGVER